MNERSAESAEVLVIGGGISGLALALAAARQGLRVTVLEADDFGGGATANSLRIVHGGLRYLQTLNVRRARRSIRARRDLMKLAPDVIRPIECRIPLSTWGVRSRVPLTIACLLADALGWDKNAGLAENDRLPGSNVWTPVSLYPDSVSTEKTPAIGWWDAVLSQPHRLIATLVRQCDSLGVSLVNHARVTELVVDTDNRVSGARYQRIGESSSTLLRCRVVVDVAGHGGRLFRRRIGSLRPVCDWVGAANFLLDEQTSGSCAIGLRVRERNGANDGAEKLGKKRDFFFVPTPSGVLAGTTYTHVEPDSEINAVLTLAYEQLLDEISRARADRAISTSDVRHFFWGLLPAASRGAGSASSRLLSRDIVIDGTKEFGLAGYIRVQGVKLTTAFELASRVVPLLQQYHSKDDSDEPVGLPELATTTVAETPAVLSLDTPSAVKLTLESMESDDVRDLVRHCVHHEYALTLEDLLQRRLGLLPFDYPGEPLRRRLAEHMARLLSWDDSRTTQELRHAESVQTEDPLNSFALAASSAKGVGL